MMNIIKIKIAGWLLLSFLISINIHAQNDTVFMSVSYDATFKNTIEHQVKHDEMLLRIGTQHSLFYSVMAEQQQQILDSIVQVSDGDLQQLLTATGGFRSSSVYGQKYRIIKHYPTDSTLTYTTSILDTNFKYEEKLPDFNWQLLGGDTVIAEYTCYKATTTFRGKTWIAWYAPDITVSEGPWKLCGLPGLIVKASTSDSNFSFTCTAIQTGNGKNLNIDLKGYKRIKPKDLQQLVKLELTNPGQLMSRLHGFDMQQTEVRRIGKRKTVTPIYIEDYNYQE